MVSADYPDQNHTSKKPSLLSKTPLFSVALVNNLIGNGIGLRYHPTLVAPS